jgi:DNA ligase-1
MKRFSDTEAEIIGYEEKMHNANPATKDAFGRTERSSHQENLVPTGTLGALLVRSDEFTNEFSIGSGFTDELRADLWKRRNQLKGKLVKFKYQPYGVKDVPRFPVFIGIRDPRDT